MITSQETYTRVCIFSVYMNTCSNVRVVIVLVSATAATNYNLHYVLSNSTRSLTVRICVHVCVCHVPALLAFHTAELHMPTSRQKAHMADMQLSV